MPDRVHHETIWIFDGNIILSVPTANKDYDVLFKVHMSVLKRESTVFSDMFSFPDPEPSIFSSGATEEYESLPLVHLYDTAEEWEKLLNILYNPMQFSLKRHDPDVPIFVDGILLLATKYQMDSIRRRIIEHIEADWPTSIAEWDNFQRIIDCAKERVVDTLDTPPEQRIKIDTMLPEPAAAIQIARRHNIPSILPAALYHLALIDRLADYDAVRRDGYPQSGEVAMTARWSLVTAEDRLQMEIGLTKMCQYTHRKCGALTSNSGPFGSNIGVPAAPDVVQGCTSGAACGSNFERLMRSVVFGAYYTRNPLLKLKRETDKRWLSSVYPLCGACILTRAPGEALLRLRAELWAKLPEFFGLTAEPQQ